MDAVLSASLLILVIAGLRAALLHRLPKRLLPPLWGLFSSEQDFSGFFSTCVLHWARGDKHGAAI